MAKNTCAGLTQAALIQALGIPKATYYDYLKVEGYPLNADFPTQKAWVDDRQKKTGAKAEDAKPRKGRSNQPELPQLPAEGTKDFYELRRVRFQSHNEEMKAQATVDRIIEEADVQIRRRLGKLMERLREIVQQELCTECSAVLAGEWDRVMAELDTEAEELAE